MTVPNPAQTGTDDLRLVALLLCKRCIAGEGGECHTPGCALYMNRAPDIPVTVVCDLKVEIPDDGIPPTAIGGVE